MLDGSDSSQTSKAKDTAKHSKQQQHWLPFAKVDALREAAVRCILTSAEQAIRATGTFRIVLAGGTTPKAIYQDLTTLKADWQNWHIFFGDERCLPIGDPDRNDQMASDAWLNQVAIPADQIHPIPAELGATQAALAYAKTIQHIENFDLVLLGLGEDGHTASLFPSHNCGTEPDAPDTLAVFNAPKPPPERVSLSAARLSRAQSVMFLVTGESKRTAVKAWRGGEHIPASLITPTAAVDILLDAPLLNSN